MVRRTPSWSAEESREQNSQHSSSCSISDMHSRSFPTTTEMSSTLRRSQSLKNLPETQKAWLTADGPLLDRRKTVSQLVHQYQSYTDLRHDSTEGWPKSPVQFRKQHDEIRGNKQIKSWERRPATGVTGHPSSLGMSSLSRSRSMDTLSLRDVTGTSALRAWFESETNLQQKSLNSPRLSATPPTTNSPASRETVRGHQRDQRWPNTPTKNDKIPQVKGVTSKPERWIPKAPESPNKGLGHLSAASTQASTSSSTSSSTSASTHDSIPSVKARSALYLSKIPAADASGPTTQDTRENFTGSRRPNKQSSVPSTAKMVCSACCNQVYPMEKITADKHTLHINCFCCKHCKKKLSIHSYSALYGEFYCSTHYQQLFKQKGNYDEGFGYKQHKDNWLKKTDDSTPEKIDPAPKYELTRVSGSSPLHKRERDVNTGSYSGPRNKLSISWPPEKKGTNQKGTSDFLMTQKATDRKKHDTPSVKFNSGNVYNKTTSNSGQHETDRQTDRPSPAVQEKTDKTSLPFARKHVEMPLQSGFGHANNYRSLKPSSEVADFTLVHKTPSKLLQDGKDDKLEPNSDSCTLEFPRKQKPLKMKSVHFSSVTCCEGDQTDRARALETGAGLGAEKDPRTVAADNLCAGHDGDITTNHVGQDRSFEKDRDDLSTNRMSKNSDDLNKHSNPDPDQKYEVHQLNSEQRSMVVAQKQTPAALSDIISPETKQTTAALSDIIHPETNETLVNAKGNQTPNKLPNTDDNEAKELEKLVDKTATKKGSLSKGKSPLIKLFKSGSKENEKNEENVNLSEPEMDTRKSYSKPKNMLSKLFQSSTERGVSLKKIQETNSNETVKTNSNETVTANSNEAVKANSNETVKTNSNETVKTNSNETACTNTNSNETVCTNTNSNETSCTNTNSNETACTSTNSNKTGCTTEEQGEDILPTPDHLTNIYDSTKDINSLSLTCTSQGPESSSEPDVFKAALCLQRDMREVGSDFVRPATAEPNVISSVKTEDTADFFDESSDVSQAMTPQKNPLAFPECDAFLSGDQGTLTDLVTVEAAGATASAEEQEAQTDLTEHDWFGAVSESRGPDGLDQGRNGTAHDTSHTQPNIEMFGFSELEMEATVKDVTDMDFSGHEDNNNIATHIVGNMVDIGNASFKQEHDTIEDRASDQTDVHHGNVHLMTTSHNENQSPVEKVQDRICQNEVYDLFPSETGPPTQLNISDVFDQNISVQEEILATQKEASDTIIPEQDPSALWGVLHTFDKNESALDKDRLDQSEVIDLFSSDSDLCSTAVNQNIFDPFYNPFQSDIFATIDTGTSLNSVAMESSTPNSGLLDVFPGLESQSGDSDMEKNHLLPEDTLTSCSTASAVQTQGTSHCSHDWMSEFLN